MKKKVFITGALTNFKRESICEQICNTVRNLGYEPVVPHRVESKKDSTQLYNLDKEKLQSSCLVVAYVGSPSLEVGIELEMANEKKIPIILMYEIGMELSNKIWGIPSVRVRIVYQSEELGINYLEREIKKINP